MTVKTLLGTGIAAIATLVLAFYILRVLERGRKTSEAAPAPVQMVSKIGSPPQAAGAVPQSAIPVTPKDLEKLAVMVDLDESSDQGFKKEKWAAAIPVAEKLLLQSCDCEQRNWLTQFVTLGNYALAGRPEYHEFAPLLATMYRDNNERITGLPSN